MDATKLVFRGGLIGTLSIAALTPERAAFAQALDGEPPPTMPAAPARPLAPAAPAPPPGSAASSDPPVAPLAVVPVQPAQPLQALQPVETRRTIEASRTVESSRAAEAREPAAARDRGSDAAASREYLADRRLLHGFRLGYGHVMNFDKRVPALGDKSLADKMHMRSPHNFLIGYEAFYRMVGHSWLNVILTGNVMIAGLEQSQFWPTSNGLLGFEFNNSFQLGVGANLAPLEGHIAHTVVAAGWTPRVGTFYTPIHAFFIPDVDGLHRVGALTGVTW